MDAYQQSHEYTRPPLPPPPSMADPHHQHHQFPPPAPPPPRQPISQPGSWYSGQFQYHPSPSSSSPSPPPPPPHHHQPPPSQHQQQWAPPPPYSDQYLPPAYPPPHHNPAFPYHAHQQPIHNQYPPPLRPHMPPPPQVNQEWGNPNLGLHQGWEFPVHSNEEDWAARARAWAASKASTDYQNVQSQSTPFARAEEQIQYHDQHPQAVNSHYSQTQQQAHPSSSYLQFVAAPTHESPVVHQQETASASSGPASYVSDGHSSYIAGDETSAGDSNVVFHQQEVPSSYSSVTGKGGSGDQAELLYRSLPFPNTSHQEGQHHVQSSMPVNGRSEQHPFAYRNHSADHPTDLSDQPLDFAPRFNRVHESQMQSSFPQRDTARPLWGMDPVAAVPSIHAWAPPVPPGIVYPPMPPVLPSGQQHDPSMAVSSSTPSFGRIPGPGFQPPVPSVTVPFGLDAGHALHSSTAFPGDAYAVSSIPDRPKKTAVPNWLREEIIKNKAVIASSAQEYTKEDTQYIEDESVEKSLGKVDQADSKSVDSSRSTDEEDEDEDYVETARTAAINQEIKRILTEVLLKVTDELFDEIATKVLSEDDQVEVNHDAFTSNHGESVSPPAVPTPKASAKVLIPGKPKESEIRAVPEKSSSNTPGDVLGLGSYASDDDEEIHTSSTPSSRENSVHPHSNMKRHSEDIHDVGENGSSQANIGDQDRYQAHLENVSNKSSPSRVKTNKSAVINEMSHNYVGRTNSSMEISGVTGDMTNVGGEMIDVVIDSELKYKVGEKITRKSEMPAEEGNAINLMPDSQGRETSTKLDKNGRYETKRSSAGKYSVKEVESSKIRIDGKGDENRVMDVKTGDQNCSKEKKKEEGANPEKKTKESDSKKNYIQLDVKDDKNETERGKRASAKGDNGKKRERVKDEKEDRSRHKPHSNSSRHKRRHSPSLGSRGRNSKDNSVVSHGNDTSDEASEDSRRRLHSTRRHLSPSPVKSRRRQLSRSPHSKHSQHRHSPYSSLETSRKKRSRSR